MIVGTEQSQQTDDQNAENVHGNNTVGRRWAENHSEQDEQGAEEDDVYKLDEQGP